MVSPPGWTAILESTPRGAGAQVRPYAFAALICTELRILKDRCACYLDAEENHVSKPKLPIETMNVAEVATLLGAGKLLLIDVREPAEFQTERIAGALLYPLSTFDAAALPEDGVRKVVFHCGSGKRSLTAAEHRLAAGQRHAAHMGGGMAAWKAAGLPVVTPGSPR